MDRLVVVIPSHAQPFAAIFDDLQLEGRGWLEAQTHSMRCLAWARANIENVGPRANEAPSFTHLERSAVFGLGEPEHDGAAWKTHAPNVNVEAKLNTRGEDSVDTPNVAEPSPPRQLEDPLLDLHARAHVVGKPVGGRVEHQRAFHVDVRIASLRHHTHRCIPNPHPKTFSVHRNRQNAVVELAVELAGLRCGARAHDQNDRG